MCIRDRVYDDRENKKKWNQESDYPEEEVWTQKLQEIYDFQVTDTKKVNTEQKDQLVAIYDKYRKVFSNLPGKAKNFITELTFNHPINFNRCV